MKKLAYGCGVVVVILTYGWITEHAPGFMLEPLTWLAIAVLVVLAVRYTLTSAARGARGATAHFGLGSGNADREYVARHEIGHALAFKKGGFTVDKVVATAGSGGTYARGTGREKDYRIALAAGAEAAARYLVKYHGYSWSKARAKAYGDSGHDMRDLRSAAGLFGTSGAKSAANDFVRSHWRRIDSEADKLARRGIIRNF